MNRIITTYIYIHIYIYIYIHYHIRILSLSGYHVSAWLLAIPNPSMGLSFNSTKFRVLLRHMLGLPLYSKCRTCPACKKALLDIYGDHSLICGTGS